MCSHEICCFYFGFLRVFKVVANRSRDCEISEKATLVISGTREAVHEHIFVRRPGESNDFEQGEHAQINFPRKLFLEHAQSPVESRTLAGGRELRSQLSLL